MGLFRGVIMNYIISKHISIQKLSYEEQDLAEIASTNFSSARCNCSYPSPEQLLAHELPSQQRHKSTSSFSWTAILENKMEEKKKWKKEGEDEEESTNHFGRKSSFFILCLPHHPTHFEFLTDMWLSSHIYQSYR